MCKLLMGCIKDAGQISWENVKFFFPLQNWDGPNNSLHFSIFCSWAEPRITAFGWLITTLLVILHSAVVTQDQNQNNQC